MEAESGAELERIGRGGCADAPPAGLARFEIDVTAPSAARVVLDRTRAVLSRVVAARAEPWPGAEEWAALLPSWFVAASGPELSPEQAQAESDRLRALSPAERIEALDRVRWPVKNFVEWFRPERRDWWWWGAEVLDEDRLRVCLVLQEPMAAHAALDWLLRAAGAESVVDENLRDLL